MVEEIQTPIDTTFYWGRQIRLSHLYLLNSASTPPTFINIAANWLTDPSAFPNAAAAPWWAQHWFSRLLSWKTF
jgi:hypothetical protein